jgi:hypothetical protein
MSQTMKQPTIIHVGGVGTNSYINAKLLNERGYSAHVAANDIYHAICAPEWQELGSNSFSRDQLGNDFFPNFFCISESIDVRKRWFAQGPQLLVINYLYHLINNNAQAADVLWDTLQYSRFKAVLARTTAPEAVKLNPKEFQKALKSLSVAKVFHQPLTQSFEAEMIIIRFADLAAKLNNMPDSSVFVPPFSTDYINSIIAYDSNLATEVNALRATGASFNIGFEKMIYPQPSC